MNCKNCPYSNHASGSGSQSSRPELAHTFGNYLQLNIPLKFKWHSVVDGNEEIVEQGELGPDMDVHVILRKGKREYRYVPIIVNNQATIIDKGQLPLGSYDIIIEIKDDDIPLRYKQNTILRVVDTTDEGHQYENDEVNVMAIYPDVEGVTTAISIGTDDVVISEAGKFKGDDTPNDNYADITAAYGDSTLEIGDNEVIINI